MTFREIYQIIIVPWFLVIAGITPWWLFDKFVLKDQLYMNLFNSSKTQFLILLIPMYLSVVFAYLVKVKFPQKGEKIVISFGKFFVIMVSIEFLLLVLGGIIWLLSLI
jgi:hypothetical protein